ncbi:Scytalone dehydratase [Aspergillus karnatakaensis]|uniref:scytalone dehydratase arp1 n=1 Tax=Aspergillus karnatakaensis TaxID=1810916 RepID=UPI003CCCF6C9
MDKRPTFEEVTGCQEALLEWAESFDEKDWDRLRKCIAPTLRIDYSVVLNKLWEDLPAEAFVAMAADPSFLGTPLLKTQHFVGASKWEKVTDDRIVGCHQMRVAHQRYTDETLTTVAVKGHSHGSATMWYSRVEGVWKFAGLCPHARWSEFDFDKVFEDMRGKVEGGEVAVGCGVEVVGG